MKRLFPIILFALATNVTTTGATPISGIAATVDNDIITTYEVNREATPLLKEAGKKAPLDDASRQQIQMAALNKLIDKKLIDQKIKELDIKIGEDEIRQAIDDVKKQNNLTQEKLLAALASQGMTYDAYRAQLKEQLERLRLVSQEVRSKVQVSEKEVRDYYESNRSRFESSDLFRARHILFRVDPKSAPAQVSTIKAKAESVLKEIRKGADFATLAKKYSDDPSAKDGGDLGVLKRGDILPELDTAVANLKAGETSEILTTPAGFVILKIEERMAGNSRSFADVKGDIETMLYNKKSDERFNQWLEELRKTASIEIKQ